MFRYQFSMWIFLLFVGLQGLMFLSQMVEKKTGLSSRVSLAEVKNRLGADFTFPSVDLSFSGAFDNLTGWASSFDISMPSFTLPNISAYLPELFWLEMFGLIAVATACVLTLWYILADAHIKAMNRRDDVEVLKRQIAHLEQALRDKPTYIIDVTPHPAPATPHHEVPVVEPVVDDDSPAAEEFLVGEVTGVVERFFSTNAESISIELLTLVNMIGFDLKSALKILTRENFSPETIGSVLLVFDESLGTTLDAMFKPGSRIAPEIRQQVMLAVSHNLHELYNIHLDHESRLAA